MATIETTPELVQQVYATTRANLDIVRRRLGRPLTLSEKIVLGHLADPESEHLDPGKAYIQTRPDRVAMQDATAQMAMLQFMQAGRDETAVPTTVHCDHLILAKSGPTRTTRPPSTLNREVYDFLQSGGGPLRHGLLEAGLGHHPPGRAGELRLPGRPDDRHRQPHAQRWRTGHDRLGVGGADAVDVMAGHATGRCCSPN
jgi:aconitate hydratase